MRNISQNTLKAVSWNLLLISTGSFIFGIGLKSIAVPQGFITGGITGLSLLFYYITDLFSPGSWYLLVNIPLFLIGWIHVSRRFFLYSLFGMAALSASIDLINFTIPLQDPFLAVLAGGCLMGAGAGITLHSLGSFGGLDIVGIILNQKYSVRLGTFFFVFNIGLFGISLGLLKVELVLYSLAMNFVTVQVMDYVLTIFNQRKMVLIISNFHQEIARDINNRLNRGATFLDGSGVHSGRDKKVILSVIHNYQLKRLEELVFSIDQDAFLIAENTFNVLGKGFSKRKIY